MEEYNKFREYELESAIIESKNNISLGKYHEDSIEDHMRRIENV